MLLNPRLSHRQKSSRRSFSRQKTLLLLRALLPQKMPSLNHNPQNRNHPSRHPQSLKQRPQNLKQLVRIFECSSIPLAKAYLACMWTLIHNHTALPDLANRHTSQLSNWNFIGKWHHMQTNIAFGKSTAGVPCTRLSDCCNCPWFIAMCWVLDLWRSITGYELNNQKHRHFSTLLAN